MSEPADRVVVPEPRARIVSVTGGTFECPHCFARWVGTWRGDPALMTCLSCNRSMSEEPRDG